MRTLALMEQGITLGVTGELFSIERDGQKIEEIRMGEIDEVLVFGSVALTPSVVAALLRRGIDTVFLSARGRYRGRLVGRPSKNVQLRLAQFDRFRDPAFALANAKAMIAGKLANQRSLLLRAQREQKREDLALAIGALRHLGRRVEEAEDLDGLRGIEGQAAAEYFGVLGKCVRNPAFAFARRSRRPPRDPANALLSFGYTLLGSAAETLLLRAGFDPMLGVFHSADFGRPSLALDLIEEFRPVVVDSLMLRLINRREVAPEDFETALGGRDALAEEETPDREAPSEGIGVWLSETGRRVFFRAWGRRLRETVFYPARGQRLTLEEILRQQVFLLGRVARGEDAVYAPFVPR